MENHHQESIHRTIEYFQQEPEVKALLLGGSLAHGFAKPTSDVDILIIVSDEDYQHRLNEGRLHFFNRELCTYAEGYVDGKYLSQSYLAQVAQKGSEPARFAFKDAQILLGGAAMEEQLRAITRYPIEGKAERIQSYYAQLEAWHWFTGEALRQGNRYLLGVAISKLVLFGGRLILTHNELLYPYHKWFLRVLAGAKEKPEALLTSIDALYEAPTADNIRCFYEMVKGYRAWVESETSWPVQFMFDSELTWQTDKSPIDDW